MSAASPVRIWTRKPYKGRCAIIKTAQPADLAFGLSFADRLDQPARRQNVIGSPMLFESTTFLLRSIVTSLEKNVEDKWDDHVEFGNQCLYELHQMSRSTSRPSKPDANAKFQ